jgi:TolB protein
MRKYISLFTFIIFCFLPYSAWAMLNMELTHGVAGAIPIALVPFAVQGGQPPQDVSAIITNDLQNSGRFKVFGKSQLSQFPSDAALVKADYFRRLGTDHVLLGKVTALGNGQYRIRVQLLDMFRGQGAGALVFTKQYSVSERELRGAAHHISDLVYQQITGTRGVFSTKIAYVVVQRGEGGRARYLLEVSDQDGYNPRPLLTSPEPIMSPSWSPNGRQLAYVSFENKHAGIYLQDVATGSRRLLSDFPGINGAPAWSPNGKTLALVLSKTGSPNIYLMDIATRRLTAITHDFYLNTEPAWSPDGKTLLFTSNRSGSNPQIYQFNLASGAVTRVSYDGDYNARASFAKDGRHIVMIHRVHGIYNIGLLDIDTGTLRELSGKAGDSASPSLAPNGSMILYDTVYGGRNLLAMVSADGRIELRLPARNGEAQDPAWSPYLG